MDHPPRNGLLAGGNFITDFVKIIDHWPEQDALALIRRESMGNGGGAYNVLKGLAALDLGWPLEAVGRVGDDANGRWILDDCRAAGIGTAGLVATTAAPTSYTDAMTADGTGRRTFFHQPGANALLGPDDFDFSRTGARVFYLGFLMLLDQLDEVGADGRTGASRVFESATAAGLRTAADLVSASDPRFRIVVLASLPFIDLLFLNELEAGRILGRTVEARRDALVGAAEELLALGARGTVVMHCADGAVAVTTDGACEVLGRVLLPAGQIAGSTGAGDAFAAGYLSAWHDGEPPAEGLRRAVNVAAASLTSPTASGGIVNLGQCMKLGEEHGCADF